MTIDGHQGNREDQLTEMLNLAFIAVRAAEPMEARRLATAVSLQLLATPHHFHECALVDICACLAGLELDWRASMRWHLAATRHFAEGGYIESPERQRRRESDLRQACAALAPAEQEDIARQAEVATLVRELEHVRAWLGVRGPKVCATGSRRVSARDLEPHFPASWQSLELRPADMCPRFGPSTGAGYGSEWQLCSGEIERRKALCGPIAVQGPIRNPLRVPSHAARAASRPHS